MQLVFKEKNIMPGGVTIFKFTHDQHISWKPGQYLHYILPHENADDRGVERWFTISSAPFENDIWISTRINDQRSSTFKQKLLQLTKGDVIEAGEPEGDFILDDTNRDYIFIIGGIGITPIRSILNQLQHDGKMIKAKLLWANRSQDTVPFRDELEAIAREMKDFEIIHFLGDEIIDQSAIKKASEGMNRPIYYVSGPEAMTESFAEMLKSMGISEQNAKFDYFPGYEANKG